MTLFFFFFFFFFLGATVIVGAVFLGGYGDKGGVWGFGCVGQGAVAGVDASLVVS